jgi:membrane-associated protease RseP (regulator of RpoE activity)
MLNLLPLAQLDGGHIAFAMFGRRQIWIARVMWAALVALGFAWRQWWVWAAIALVIGRGRLAHPRVISPWREISTGRRLLGYAAIALFVLCFIPLPVVL